MQFVVGQYCDTKNSFNPLIIKLAFVDDKIQIAC